MEKSGPSVGTIFLVYLSLMALLVLTAFASLLTPPWLSNSLSLGIAAAKAALILAFFMHLRYRPLRYGVLGLAGVLWLVFLFAITLADYLTRGTIQIIGK